MGFIFLIIVENLFISFMLIVNSQPTYGSSQQESTKTNGNLTQDGQFLGTISTPPIHLFKLISLSGPVGGLTMADLSLTSTTGIICVAIFGSCVALAFILLYLLMSTQANQAMGVRRFLLQLTQLWMALHRTILTFVIAFAITANCLILNGRSQSGNSSDQTSYILVILMIVGLLSFIVTATFSFQVMRLPIRARQIPWNSTPSSVTYTREVFKVLIVVQDYFFQEFDISSSQTILSFYQVFLVGVLIATALMQEKPSYFDPRVARASLFTQGMTISVGIGAVCRAIFDASDAFIGIFIPIILLTSVKLLMMLEETRNLEGLISFIDAKKESPLSSFKAIQYLTMLHDKIKGDPSLGMSDAHSRENSLAHLDLSLTSEDSKILAQLHYLHRVTCKNGAFSCICDQYEYIWKDQFTLHSDSVPLIDDKRNQREENHQDAESLEMSASYDKKVAPKNSLKKNLKEIVRTIIDRAPQEEVKNSNDRSSHLNDSKGSFSMMGLNSQSQMYTKGQQDRFGQIDQNSTEMKNPNFQQQTNRFFERGLSIIDVFLKGRLFKNSNLAALGERAQRYTMIEIGAQSTKQSIREHVVSLGFKSQNEAKAYYNLHLIAILIDLYGKNISSAGNEHFGSVSENRLFYIQFQGKSKPFLAIQNILKSIYSSRASDQSRGQGIFQRIQVKVCEQLIMQEVMQHISTKLQQFDTAVDFSSYIEKSHTLKHLDDLYDDTAVNIGEFWKHWGSPEVNIDMVFKKGLAISRVASKITSLEGQLEQEAVFTESVIERQLLRMTFHEELLHDPWTAKRIRANLKSRTIGDRRSVFDNSQDKGTEQINMGRNDGLRTSEAGLCLVAISSLDFHSMEFLYVNKVLANIVGISEARLEGQNIKLIMPKVIRENHDEIIARFFQRGSTRLLGKQRVAFLKDGKGFVKPVRFKLEFTNNPRFNYAFLGQIEQLKYINTDSESTVLISLKDAMIFITDRDNQITEITQNVLDIAGFNCSFERWENAQELRGRTFSMNEFIRELSQIQIRASDSVSGKSLSMSNEVVHFRKYSMKTEDFDEENSFLAVVTCVQESYLLSNSFTATQVIYIVTPASRHPEGEQLLRKGSSFANLNDSSKRNRAHLVKSKDSLAKVDDEEDKNLSPSAKPQGSMEKLESTTEGDGFNSNSVSSAVSSNASSQSDSAYMVQSLLFKNKAPRVLKMTLLVISLVYFVFFVIILYNLILFVNRHSLISGRINIYQVTAQRNLGIRGLLLDVISIHQMIIYPQLQASTPSLGPQSRLHYYEQIFNSNKNQTRIAENADEVMNINDIITSSLLNTSFLSDDNHAYIELRPFKNWNNQFIQEFESLNLTTFEKQKPALNINGYPTSGAKNSTDTQKILYYLFVNGVTNMEATSYMQAVIRFEQSMQESATSRAQLSLAMIVSITVMSVALLSLFPMLMRLLRLRYRVIEFLQYLSFEQVEDSYQQSLRYQQRLKAFTRQSNAIYENVEEESKEAPRKKEKDGPPANKLKIIEGTKNKKGNKKQLTKMKAYEKEEVPSEVSEIEQEDSLSDHTNPQVIQSQKQTAAKERKSGQDMMKNQMFESIKIQIRRKNFTEQLNILILVVLCICYFNSVLIGSQIYGNQVFLNNEDAQSNIQAFFDRERCAININLLTKNRLVKNTTSPTNWYTGETTFVYETGTQRFIDLCTTTENSIENLVSQMPAYISSSAQLISSQADERFCNDTYLDKDPNKAALCEGAMGGILQGGVQSAIRFMVKQITQLAINFEAFPAQRTKQWLANALNDPINNEMVDLTLFFLRDGFHKMQQSILDSLNVYVLQVRLNYVLLLSIFLCVTTVLVIGLCLYFFRNAKRNILDIQNMVALLPLADLEPTQRQVIEKYING